MNRIEFPSFVEALRKSEGGRSLQDTYRWSQFRTTESNEVWMKYYGKTAQVFTHGVLFFNYMRWFIQKESGRFSPEEENTLLWGAAPHDAGEAKINGEKFVGDKLAYKKTVKDEVVETKVAYRVISSLDLPDAAKERLLIGYKKVIEGEDPKLHHAFKALEKSEYVFTAMKVYLNTKRLKGGFALTNPEPMIGRVLIFDLAKVLDVYVPLYPNSIGKFFHDNSSLIDEMFNYSLPWLNSHDEWAGKPTDHRSIARTFKAKWEAFKNQG